MLFRQRVKTVTHIVELPNFVQDRIRIHEVRGFPESPPARARRNCRKFVGDDGLGTCSRGKTESNRLPRDMFTDLYAATASLWKVEVTASNV